MSPPSSTRGEMPPLIDFVNRHDDIRSMTHIYCPPYLLVSAPKGYGKTRLIEAVEEQLKRHYWYSIRVTLSEIEFSSIQEIAGLILKKIEAGQLKNEKSATPEELGHDVGRSILKKLDKTQKNVILFVDDVGDLDDDLAEKFLNHFILAIQEILDNAGSFFRFILAGRYESRWIQLSSALEIRLKTMLLSLFNFSSVYQTVENFCTKSHFNASPGYKKEFASYLMYCTGGHPECVVKILNKDSGLNLDKITLNENEHYEEIVSPIIEEIRACIPDGNLKNVFDTLSVVRRFTPGLLRNFIEKQLITWNHPEYELENLLLRTYLVNKESGFLKDNITRRLLAIRLRETALAHFIKVCETSISFYELSLKDSKSYRPEIIAIEQLFQQLQFFLYNPIFKLTEPSLKNLKEENIPGKILEGLKFMKDREFEEEDTFLNAVKKQLGEDQTEKYKKPILEHAQNKVVLFKEHFLKIFNAILRTLAENHTPAVTESFIELLKKDWEFRFTFNYLFKESIYDIELPFKELIEKAETFSLDNS